MVEGSTKGFAMSDVGVGRRSSAERVHAMKLGFAIPIVGPAVRGAAGLSTFCRGLEDLGYGTLWVGDRLLTPVNMHSTYPGKEQPYPPQMTRYLDPVLLWTVAVTATSQVRLSQHAQQFLLGAGSPGLDLLGLRAGRAQYGQVIGVPDQDRRSRD